jgi:hypothetical protein
MPACRARVLCVRVCGWVLVGFGGHFVLAGGTCAVVREQSALPPSCVAGVVGLFSCVCGGL